MAPMVAIHVSVAIHQGDHSLCISFSHVTIAKYCDDTTNTINATTTTTNIPRRSLTASHYTRYYPRPQRHCLPLTWILFLCSCNCICVTKRVWLFYEFVFAILHVFAFAMLIKIYLHNCTYTSVHFTGKLLTTKTWLWGTFLWSQALSLATTRSKACWKKRWNCSKVGEL